MRTQRNPWMETPRRSLASMRPAGRAPCTTPAPSQHPGRTRGARPAEGRLPAQPARGAGAHTRAQPSSPEPPRAFGEEVSQRRDEAPIRADHDRIQRELLEELLARLAHVLHRLLVVLADGPITGVDDDFLAGFEVL